MDDRASREQAEGALSAAEQNRRLRAAFEGMDEGFYLVELIRDPAGQTVDLRYLEENPAAARLVGASVHGQRLSEINPGFEREWLTILQRVADTGEAERFDRPSIITGRFHSYHAFPSASGEDQVGVLSSDVTDRRAAEEALRQSEASLVRELEATTRLQRLSGELISARDIHTFYDKLLQAMVAIMRAQAATMQIYDPEPGVLRLLAKRGLDARSAEHWRTIDAGSSTACGRALRENRRIVVRDIMTEGWPEEGIESFRLSGVRSVQSTPLVSRSGRLLGMISTLWSGVHQPAESDLRHFDVIARQAADFLERAQADESLRASEERQKFLLKLSDALRPIKDPIAIHETACRMTAEFLDIGRVAYCEIRYEPDIVVVVERDWPRRGMPSVAAGRYRMADFGPVLAQELTAGRPAIVADAATDPRLSDSERARWGQFDIVASCAVPVVKQGRFVAYLAAQDNRPYQWTDVDRQILTEVSERTWAAVERARAEEALREAEERLREFGEASNDVLWMRDAATLRWTYLSRGFEVIYGAEREEALAGDTLRNWAELIVPEDRTHALECIRRVREGERTTFEYRIRRPSDGQIRWLRDTDFPMRDVQGKIVRIGGIGADITALKAAEEHQNVLLAELQHRVRNTLAVVRSIARRTGETSDSAEDMLAHFEGRLDAFSRVQAAVTRSAGGGVDLASLIEDEMVAHAARDGDQLRIEGPPVTLRSKTAERLSLAIHELTTNAVKHGALTSDTGRISIRWTREHDGNGSETLDLRWAESGIESDSRGPRRDGFGMELLRRSLPYDLDAETTIEIKPDGLHFGLRMPLRSPPET